MLPEPPAGPLGTYLAALFVVAAGLVALVVSIVAWAVIRNAGGSALDWVLPRLERLLDWFFRRHRYLRALTVFVVLNSIGAGMYITTRDLPSEPEFMVVYQFGTAVVALVVFPLLSIATTLEQLGVGEQ